MGHYIRSLTGHSRDRAAMYALGTRDAQRNRGNRYSLVLLDIGGQVRGGIRQSVNGNFVSYGALVSAIGAYINGYTQHRDHRLVVTIAVGTNNDLVTSRATGAAWAKNVVNPLRHRAAKARNLQVIGANDIEPGFSSGVHAARLWMLGYLQATKAPLLFNGSADGCSTIEMASGCNGGWTAKNLAWFAGLVAPNRILVMPQIYNHAMAAQWAQIAKTAVVYGHRRLQFVGPLTETAACGGDPACPTMPSSTAWLALWHGLRSSSLTRVASLPAQTDLDIH